MAANNVVSRLRYLNDAAHSLALNSPAVSAHMMSQYNKLIFENELESSDVRKREVCGACGNIMVPGWTCSVRLERERQKKALDKVQKSKPRSQNTSSVSASTSPDNLSKNLNILYECLVCERTTRQRVSGRPKRFPTAKRTMPAAEEPPSALHTRTMSPFTPTRDSSSSTPGPDKTSSVNASSKKRAKARKQGGLQALVAKKSTGGGSAGDFGFDLMDFMKT